MDRLTEMTCFVRTVETGSFAAAGKTLFMSPQLVGKHMAMLEERLGVQLLIRTTRRHRLTEAGKAFYDRCRAVVKEAADAEASVADLGTRTRGQLLISAPYTFGTWRMMPFIAAYLGQNDQVSVKLVLTDRNVDVIGESFDAVIRIGALEDSSLICRRLASLRLSACASPSYIARNGLPKVPSDLKSHECLIYNYWFRPPLTDWTFEKAGRTETVTVSGRLQVNDGRAVIQAALLGYGIVLQDHDILIREVDAGRLVHLLPDYRGPPREVHVIYPPSRRVSPKLRTFIDALAEHLG
jgi:DNA-binding transcriptional LysR family regulator